MKGYNKIRLQSARTPGLYLLCAFLISGCAGVIRPNFTTEVAQLRSGAYQLDKDHAYVHFKIDHLGLSTVVGRFNQVDAVLDFDPDNLTALALDGQIDTGSIDMNNEDLERRLRGSDWLDTDQFPVATFETISVQEIAGNSFEVIGDFTLRGVTQPITLDARFVGGADNLLTGKYTVGFEATGAISRAAFGIDGFAALIGDDVRIEIHAEFQRND